MDRTSNDEGGRELWLIRILLILSTMQLRIFRDPLREGRPEALLSHFYLHRHYGASQSVSSGNMNELCHSEETDTRPK